MWNEYCTDVCGVNQTEIWTIYNDSSCGVSFRDEFHPVDTLEECQNLCLYNDGCNFAGEINRFPSPFTSILNSPCFTQNEQ